MVRINIEGSLKPICSPLPGMAFTKGPCEAETLLSVHSGVPRSHCCSLGSAVLHPNIRMSLCSLCPSEIFEGETRVQPKTDGARDARVSERETRLRSESDI